MLEYLKRVLYKAAFYYQKLEIIILSIFVAGLVDYFFLYEFLMSLAPIASVLALEAAPLVFTVLLIVAVRVLILYVRKKMRERKNYSFLW